MGFSSLVEVVEFVRDKLIEQGCQSADAHICMYRIQVNGVLKCAIGWLIPDDMYYNGLERMTLDNSAALQNILKEELGDIYNEKVLVLMQKLHDRYKTEVNNRTETNDKGKTICAAKVGTWEEYIKFVFDKLIYNIKNYDDIKSSYYFEEYILPFCDSKGL